ncbi:hypothetical protein PMAYCL1PPCAC_13412 [Pristionchus mayeri]|uniref:SHSP domain-containing protein n=1 Tax=Pristionchus mayeri TaxID=1317129 RepID=A0AAN5CGC6_9BILA|nr:hypothetical protein PMAYCL1PPCAC_13412 [Pristionchus mayeri]
MSRYYEREEYRLEERERKNGHTTFENNEGWSRQSPLQSNGYSTRRGTSVKEYPRDELARESINIDREPLREDRRERDYYISERSPVYPTRERESRWEREETRRAPTRSDYNSHPITVIERERDFDSADRYHFEPYRRPISEVRGTLYAPRSDRDPIPHRHRSHSLRRPKVTEEYKEYRELRRSTDNLASVGRPSNGLSAFERDSRDMRETPFYSVSGRRSASRHDLSSPLESQSRPGSPGQVAGVGDIVNTEHGFTIQLDVNHFRPEEIKVVLTGDLLCVSGDRLDRTPSGGPQTQTLRRTFSRKYCIPSDIKLDSIQSHLTDSGFLIINGARRGWKETQIMAHPPSYNEFAASRGYNERRHASGRNSVISHV